MTRAIFTTGDFFCRSAKPKPVARYRMSFGEKPNCPRHNCKPFKGIDPTNHQAFLDPNVPFPLIIHWAWWVLLGQEIGLAMPSLEHISFLGHCVRTHPRGKKYRLLRIVRVLYATYM